MPRSLLFKNIGLLAGIQSPDITRLKGKDMSILHSIGDAYLFSEDGVIRDFGPDADCPYSRADQEIDCTGRIVMPAYCDSHTHLVFAAWRENEFVDRIHGITYEEIARRGGGILNSATRLQTTSEDELYESAKARLLSVIKMGTGAIEIKSGYGLTVDSELKMLRVIRRLKELDLVPIKASFLGAHAMPSAFKENRQGYIDQIIYEMLPAIAAEGLADYMDVFCDKGFYTVEETDQLLEAGHKYGLSPKIHANELDYSGGIQIGVKHGAISVDHLEYTGEDEITCLGGSQTVATILPSTAFFLGLPYAPARKMIDAGLCVAMATDFNPGSSPGGNPSFILSLGCIKMKMTPEESLNALTINGAAAMECTSTNGSITKGKLANLIITQPSSNLAVLPYQYSHHWVDKTLIKGKVF